MSTSSALPIARAALRILMALNWLTGAAIFTLLIATVAAERWTFAALGFGPLPLDANTILGLRAIAVIGVAAVPLNDVVLRRLSWIVGTVRRGDPFVAANAQRLQAIAWALLALQLLGLAVGGIATAISTSDRPLHLDAGFSTSGWLAVILTFVLARVFAEGASMRDDLAGTV